MAKESKIKLKSFQNEESSIKIKVSKKEKKVAKKKLEANKKWREDRRGNWTGVQFKNLMSCGPGKGRLAWDNLDRLFSFGATALKSIYENAMERKTGRYIEEGEGTYQMRYGTRVEPLIAKFTKAELKRMKVKGKMKTAGYKSFPNIPNSGVTSDAILVDKNEKTIASVEMKACTTWNTHYDRTFNLTDEKSKDFWQIGGQTIAHSVDICYYAVAEPPQDIKKYLFYNGNIMDMYDDFIKECKITIEVVKPSQLHKEALTKRIIIAEDTLNDWLSMQESLKKNLDETIALYEKEPKRLNKYIPPFPFRNEVTKEVLKKFKKKKKTANQNTFLKEKKKLLKNTKTIEIAVQTPAWSENDKNWCFLTKSNNEYKAWSEDKWFPKKICKLKKSENEGVGILEIPKWLYKKKFKK